MTFWLEVIGWLGSAVLVWSLAQARVLRFRALNLVASVVLTGYNAALGVWPMVAMNTVIAGLDTYHLVRLLRSRDDEATYQVVEVEPDEAYLQHVLQQHAPDIERHNPGFSWDGGADAKPGRAAFLVLRDIETVGVVLLSDHGGGEGAVSSTTCCRGSATSRSASSCTGATGCCTASASPGWWARRACATPASTSPGSASRPPATTRSGW